MSGFKSARPAAARRIVLLGASNLTRGISTVVATAQGIWNQPLQVVAAHGHGRSYGMTSSVLGRQLPGITQCDLWPALDSLPPAPTSALLTDIGNDLLYDASPETITAWLAICLDRLEAAGAKTVVTRLPVASLQALSPQRFGLLRRIIFPGSRLPHGEAIRLACELDERVVELAAQRELVCVSPALHWYGLDPIHIRLRHWSSAWGEILGQWSGEPSTARASASIARWVYLRTRMPHRLRWMGIERVSAQPCGRLRDGTTIAFY
ncbi:MAG: hypothetical protein WDZ59_15855 [Pirellulales bacterium]